MKSSKYMQYNNAIKTPVQVRYAWWVLCYCINGNKHYIDFNDDVPYM